MELFFPWGAFLRKTGGTIFGNLTVNGQFQTLGNALFNTMSVGGLAIIQQLQVNALTQLNGKLTVNDQVEIIWDDLNVGQPHLKLVDDTAAGLQQMVWTEDFASNFNGGFIGANGIRIGVVPGIGGTTEIPLPVFAPDPPLLIPLLAQPLGARRQYMLHAMMFGM